jgi:uncharacterized membrane protein YcaP (DUF421 family)
MSFDTFWGQGRDLDALQMAVRAFVVFFVTLTLVRISGRRSFMRRSAFDNIIVIMLGAVLSRPIYGASPFWPVVAGSTVMVVVHRVLGMSSARLAIIERVVKGRSFTLWKDGTLDRREMVRHELSTNDLDAAARMQAHRARYTEVGEVHLETSGELSVVDTDA